MLSVEIETDTHEYFYGGIKTKMTIDNLASYFVSKMDEIYKDCEENFVNIIIRISKIETDRKFGVKLAQLLVGICSDYFDDFKIIFLITDD